MICLQRWRLWMLTGRWSRRRFLVFLTGVLWGTVVAAVVFHVFQDYEKSSQRSDPVTDVNGEIEAYLGWLSQEGVFRLGNVSSETQIKVNEAEYLYDRIPIACVVFSSTRRQSRAVVGTWGRHCNSLDFVATFEDKFIPVTVKASSENADLLCRTLQEVSVKRLKDGQNGWVLLSLDTTFAVIENLRRLVAPLNSSEVHYLGHAVKKTASSTWAENPGQSRVVNTMSAGIVLSQGAVLQLAYAFGPDCQKVQGETQIEDLIGAILNEEEVSRPDTRDPGGRMRFLARPLGQLLRPGVLSPYDNFLKASVYPPAIGPKCCSPIAVTLAGADALEMHLWELLIARMGIGAPTSADRGLGGAPLRDPFVPPVAIEGDEPPLLPKAPKEL